MNENLHERARQLLAESIVEGLVPADEAWLREHLAACADCAKVNIWLGCTERTARSALRARILAGTELPSRMRAR